MIYNSKPEYEILEILNSKLDNRRHICKLLYLVRWFGYEGTDEETSWLPANELAHTSNILRFSFQISFQTWPSFRSVKSVHPFLFFSVVFPSFLFIAFCLLPFLFYFHLILPFCYLISFSYSHKIKSRKNKNTKIHSQNNF